MTISQMTVVTVLWLTRIAGAVFAFGGGLGFMISGWLSRSIVLAAFAIFPIVFGAVCMSIRPAAGGGLEYGLLRRRR
jgi:hypothetical protein